MSQHHRSDKDPARPMVTSVIVYTIGAFGIRIVDSYTVDSEVGEQSSSRGARGSEEGASGSRRRAAPGVGAESGVLR